MTQLKLFEIEPTQPEKPELTCRSCMFRFKHEYAKTFYCEKQSSTRTSNGCKIVKAGDRDCMYHEPKTKS